MGRIFHVLTVVVFSLNSVYGDIIDNVLRISAVTSLGISIYTSSYTDVVDTVSNMQTTSQNIAISESFTKLTDRVEWTMLSQKGSDDQRRLLSEEVIETQIQTPWHKAKQLLQIVATVVIPVTSFHAGMYYISNRYNMKLAGYMKGILGVPGFQFLTCVLLANPFMSAAASLCSVRTTYAYLACSGMMILIPVPLISFAFYVVRHYVQSGKARFIPHNHRTVGAVLWTNLYGKWQPDEVNHKYGIFYEHIRGPHKLRSDIVNRVRVYHVPIKLVKSCAFSFALACFPKHIFGNVRQCATLVILSTLYVILIYTTNPLNGFRQQICECIMEVCETLTYSFALALSIYINWYALDKDYDNLTTSMVNTQSVKLSILIFSQGWAAAFLLSHIIYAKVQQYKAAHTQTTHSLKTSKKDAANNVKTEVIENGEEIEVGGGDGDNDFGAAFD